MHGVSDTCGAYYWSPGLERPAPGPSRAEPPRGESDSERQLERRERIRHNVFMYEVWRVRERACVEFCTFVWLSFLRIEPRPTDARVSTVVASRLDRASTSRYAVRLRGPGRHSRTEHRHRPRESFYLDYNVTLVRGPRPVAERWTLRRGVEDGEYPRRLLLKKASALGLLSLILPGVRCSAGTRSTRPTSSSEWTYWPVSRSVLALPPPNCRCQRDHAPSASRPGADALRLAAKADERADDGRC